MICSANDGTFGCRSACDHMAEFSKLRLQGSEQTTTGQLHHSIWNSLDV
jgi:hypothetical protein